jgi:hypothetical protein
VKRNGDRRLATPQILGIRIPESVQLGHLTTNLESLRGIRAPETLPVTPRVRTSVEAIAVGDGPSREVCREPGNRFVCSINSTAIRQPGLRPGLGQPDENRLGPGAAASWRRRWPGLLVPTDGDSRRRPGPHGGDHSRHCTARRARRSQPRQPCPAPTGLAAPAPESGAIATRNGTLWRPEPWTAVQ